VDDRWVKIFKPAKWPRWSYSREVLPKVKGLLFCARQEPFGGRAYVDRNETISPLF
jgi:hypothetical protein